jgi:hypothetical protein
MKKKLSDFLQLNKELKSLNELELIFRYTTAEVRWFFDEKNKSFIQELFFNNQDILPLTEQRTDSYLVIANDDTIGTKLREGRLEIKSLIKTIPNIPLGDNNLYNIELWSKYSENIGDLKTFLSEISATKNRFIDILKTRDLRKFKFIDNDLIEIDTSLDPYVEGDGCNVELTQVNFNQLRFWTFAIEAFSLNGHQEDIVKRAVSTILKIDGNHSLLKSLNDKYNLSYPGFINTHYNSKEV